MISRDRASLGHVIPFPAAQRLPAKIPAGGRTCLVNSTTPSRNTARVRFFFLQVPAGGVGQENPVGLPEPPFAEVMQLVRFALPYRNDGKPAAALAAAAAGAGDLRGARDCHGNRFDPGTCKGNGVPVGEPAS